MKKHFLIRLTLMMFFVLHLNNLKAQKPKPDKNGPTSNIASFLDDGLGKKRYNLVRLKLGRLASGYAGLSYERKFSRRFGLEVGGFIKTFNGVHLDIDMGFNIKNGLNLIAFPKKYVTGKAMNKNYYWGPCYRFMSGKIDEKDEYSSRYKGDMIGHTLTLNAGSHKQIAKNFTFGVEAGLGVYTYNTKVKQIDSNGVVDPNSYNGGDFNTFAVIDFNFGILF